MNSTTKQVTLCALFAALNAILAQISIPIGPVPINLVHISTFVAAGLLGSKYGALSQFTYALMGMVGLPVFSGFSGGLGVIVGPTGGYILAYIMAAYVSGLIMEHFGKKSVIVIFMAMYTGWIITYGFGTIWYSAITHTGFIPALMVCAVPFLFGDLFKTCFSVYMVKRLSPVFRRMEN